MSNSKPRVIKDYEKLTPEVQEQIKLTYPNGFHNHLVEYVDKAGKKKKALPFEAEEYYYLIRMSIIEAKKIISDDDDYDEDGILRDEVQEEYQDKYTEEGDSLSNDDIDPYADSDEDEDDSGSKDEF